MVNKYYWSQVLPTQGFVAQCKVTWLMSHTLYSSLSTLSQDFRSGPLPDGGCKKSGSRTLFDSPRIEIARHPWNGMKPLLRIQTSASRANTQDKRALIDLPTLKESLSGFFNNYVGFVKGKDTLRPCCTHLEASARSKVTRKTRMGRGP